MGNECPLALMKDQVASMYLGLIVLSPLSHGIELEQSFFLQVPRLRDESKNCNH